MLTRFCVKSNYRSVVRCLSDKTKDDGKSAETKVNEESSNKNKQEQLNDHLQKLLKSMKTEPKINEAEYRAKFATIPDMPKPEKKVKQTSNIKMDKIEEKLTKAAGDVASAIGGDVKHTEAELLSRVLGKINQTSTTLSDLLVGMKVDRNREGDESKPRPTRGQQVKRLVERSSTTENTRFQQRQTKTGAPRPMGKRTVTTTSVNVFSGQALGIFKPLEPNYGTKLEVWEKLQERELTLATAQPPANYFEKMILWTEQGKVWRFPLDNEQGLDEEKKVHFSEHVFIDSHLEGWCPKKGPVRHFMELVCVGLSKNAFYTAQEKKDHIMWYKEYFVAKKDLLSEVGAWDVDAKSEASP